MNIVAMMKKHFPNVETVKDARKAVVIHVEDKDNRRGKKGDFGACALAKACKRELKADGAFIGLSTSYLVFGNKALRYSTPVAVGREITSFDRHGDFQSGTYSLAPFSPSQRMGIHSAGGFGNKNGKPMKHHVHRTLRVRTV